MNATNIVLASFIAGLFLSLAFSLSMNKEQQELIDQEDSERLMESYTRFQSFMLGTISASVVAFSVAGVFLAIELVMRFK